MKEKQMQEIKTNIAEEGTKEKRGTEKGESTGSEVAHNKTPNYEEIMESLEEAV